MTYFWFVINRIGKHLTVLVLKRDRTPSLTPLTIFLGEVQKKSCKGKLNEKKFIHWAKEKFIQRK